MTSPIAGEREALQAVAEKLRRAGAAVPVPEVKGTIESAMQTGLSIALCLVEQEIEILGAALLEPVGEGWVMVPKEPTEEMNRAGLNAEAFKEGEWHSFDDTEAIYRAMLAASPKSKGADTLTDDQLERMALAAGAFAVPKQGRMSTVHWFQTGVRAGYALASPPRAIPAEQAAPTEPKMIQALRSALKAVNTPIGNMVDRHEAVMRRMNAQLEWQRACTPAAIEWLLSVLAAHPHEAADRSAEALARMLPIFEKLLKDVVFTADKAGQVAADMNTLRAAMGTPAAAEPGKDGVA